jgi:hypothetical protein
VLPDEEGASVGLVGWKRKSKPGGKICGSVEAGSVELLLRRC